MSMIHSQVDRRSFVKAAMAGGSLALLSPLSQQALAQKNANVKRLIVWYVPEGCAPQAFWPKANPGRLKIDAGASIDKRSLLIRSDSIRSYADDKTATYCLQPLSKHESDISIYSGFKTDMESQTGPNPHANAISTALTGGTPQKGSFDQIMAQKLKGNSPNDSIYFPVYGHHVRDRGAADEFMSPVRDINGKTIGNPTWNPVTVYNDLFPNGIPNAGSGKNKAGYGISQAKLELLKSAAAELEVVRCIGGEAARGRLESLLSSFESLERRTQRIIDADSKNTPSHNVSVALNNNWLNTAGTRSDASKYWNNPQNFEKLVDIAIDTTVAAFALDRTRVSTLQFSATGGNAGPAKSTHYNSLKIPGIEAGQLQDHLLTHDITDSKKRNQARIFKWYYSKMAYLIEQLKNTPDGVNGGSLFDSTLIVAASDFGMMNHRNWDLPYLVAGGLNGAHKTGFYRDAYRTGQKKFRDSADFFLGLAQMFDPKIKSFGLSKTAYDFT